VICSCGALIEELSMILLAIALSAHA